jgi:hypothetical protein
MVDMRRALPAVPTALCAGIAAAVAGAGWHPAVLGPLVGGASLVATYRRLARWSEPGRRRLGLTTAGLLGFACWLLLSTVAVLALMLAPLGGSAHTAEAQRDGLALLALGAVAGIAVPGIHGLVDRVTRSR